MNHYPQIIRSVSSVRAKRWKMSMSPFTKEKLELLHASFKEGESAFDTAIKVYGDRYIERLKSVPSKDLVEELEQFSVKERHAILKNVFALELNKGCTGGCYFCLYGKKPGVISKYSFSSLVEFKDKYLKLMSADDLFLRNWRYSFSMKYGHLPLLNKIADFSDNTTVLYNDSDPLTYYDIYNGKQVSFIDVYRLLVSGSKGHFTPVLTTSLPLGTEPFLITFIDGIFSDYFEKGIPFPLLRFSLAKHNVQRIEQTLLVIYHFLRLKGYSDDQINLFFQDKEHCRFAIRDEKTIWNVGDLFHKSDKYRDVISPHCIDGVVLSPGDHRVMIGTAVSENMPSGSDRMPLSPGDVFDVLVKHETMNKYARFYDVPTELYLENDHYLHLISMNARGKVLFPQAKLADSEIVFGGLSSISVDQAKYILSRYLFSLRHLVLFIGSLRLLFKTRLLRNNNVADKFFVIVTKEYQKEKREILANLVEIFKVSAPVEEVDFVKVLLFQIKMMDLILEVYQSKGGEVAARVAGICAVVGEKHNQNIDQILALLRKKYVG